MVEILHLEQDLHQVTPEVVAEAQQQTDNLHLQEDQVEQEQRQKLQQVQWLMPVAEVELIDVEEVHH